MDALHSDLLGRILDSIDYDDPAIWQVRLLCVCKRWYAYLSARQYKLNCMTMHRYSALVVARRCGQWPAPSEPTVVVTDHFMDTYWHRIDWFDLAHHQHIPARHDHRVDWAFVSRVAVNPCIARYNSKWIRWDPRSGLYLTEEAAIAAWHATSRHLCWDRVFKRPRSLWFTLKYGCRSIHGINRLAEMVPLVVSSSMLVMVACGAIVDWLGLL